MCVGSKCDIWRSHDIASVTRHVKSDAKSDKEKLEQINRLSHYKFAPLERWNAYFDIFGKGTKGQPVPNPYHIQSSQPEPLPPSMYPLSTLMGEFPPSPKQGGVNLQSFLSEFQRILEMKADLNRQILLEKTEAILKAEKRASEGELEAEKDVGAQLQALLVAVQQMPARTRGIATRPASMETIAGRSIASENQSRSVKGQVSPPTEMPLGVDPVHRAQTERQRLETSSGFEKSIRGPAYALAEMRNMNETQLSRIEDKLFNVELEVTNLAKEREVLQSLTFERMSVRHSSIPNAHEKTFRWILHPSRFPSSDPRSEVGFRDWLSHGEGTYWISGKAGSGKSTLMKYLYNCQDTKDCLRVWANGARLATAGFFFWLAGTEMQKSQQGLLQQLLFEILSTSPQWIQTICPERCLQDFQPAWSVPELLATFKNLQFVIASNDSPTKLCLFIDGLDECNNDHLDLIKTMQYLGGLENVKICVSSRPYNYFEDAFGQYRQSKLELQRLTRDDIARYVQDKLQVMSKFSLWNTDDLEFEHLISKIVDRAEGVFLWVFLVARSLREGVLNGDPLSLLHERLMEIPSDLEEFFDEMIRSVDKVYRRRMAHTFQIALASHKPLRLLLYAFTDEGSSHSTAKQLVISASCHRRSHNMLELEDNMKRQLNERYKGLLESTGSPGTMEVEFLHRTVRDFLAGQRMQSLFLSHSDSNFNAHVCVCEAFISQTKAFPGSLVSAHLDNFLVFAQKVEENSQSLATNLLEGMDNVFYSASSKLRYRLDEYDGQATSLLGKAIQSGFVSFVKLQIDKDPGVLERSGSEPLFLALEPWCKQEATQQRISMPKESENAIHLTSEIQNRFLATKGPKVFESHYETVEFLLSRGAATKWPRHDECIVEVLLESAKLPCKDVQGPLVPVAFSHEDMREISYWYFRLVLLLLKHGVSLRDQNVKGDSFGVWRALNGCGFRGFWQDEEIQVMAVEIFRLLFERGLDPNIKAGRGTLWQELIWDLKGAPDVVLEGLGKELVKLFLLQGADTLVVVHSNGTSGTLLGEVFQRGTQPYSEVIEAWKQAVQRRPKVSSSVTPRGKKRVNERVESNQGLSEQN